MRWRHVNDPPSLGQRHRLEAALIEEVPEIARDLVIGALDGFDDPIAEMLLKTGAHEGEQGLSLEHLTGIAQRAMKRQELLDGRMVFDVRIVHGWADQPLVEYVGSHVEHALAVSHGARGPSIVHNVRRQ